MTAHGAGEEGRQVKMGPWPAGTEPSRPPGFPPHPLTPGKKLSVFRRGLLQGAVYGAIAAALLFLCLVLSV